MPVHTGTVKIEGVDYPISAIVTQATALVTGEELRKLSAVLSADVKGYSRLMGEDESGTVRTLKEYCEIITELIQKYRGRVVDSPGDNLLAEFASVVDAVDSAVET